MVNNIDRILDKELELLKEYEGLDLKKPELMIQDSIRAERSLEGGRIEYSDRLFCPQGNGIIKVGQEVNVFKFEAVRILGAGLGDTAVYQTGDIEKIEKMRVTNDENLWLHIRSIGYYCSNQILKKMYDLGELSLFEYSLGRIKNFHDTPYRAIAIADQMKINKRALKDRIRIIEELVK